MAQSKEFEVPFPFNNSSTAAGFTGLHHRYQVENFHSLPFDRVSGLCAKLPTQKIHYMHNLLKQVLEVRESQYDSLQNYWDQW